MKMELPPARLEKVVPPAVQTSEPAAVTVTPVTGVVPFAATALLCDPATSVVYAGVGSVMVALLAGELPAGLVTVIRYSIFWPVFAVSAVV